MPIKHFYCVSRGITPGIYTEWSRCEKNIHKVQHAVQKGFKTIDEAVIFLLSGGAFHQCCSIPVFDDTDIPKKPCDYGHKCVNSVCTPDDLDLSSIDTPMGENVNNMNESFEQTHVKIVDEETPVQTKENATYKEKDNINPSLVPSVNSAQSSSDKIETTPVPQNTPLGEDKHSTKSTGTCLCNKEDNESMIECSKCKKYTHYLCTHLPVYQLYVLINSARKYTCEQCANVPAEFSDKWKLLGNEQNKTADNIDNKTLEFVSRMEKTVTQTLTSIYNNGKDEIISQLKAEVDEQKKITSKALSIDNKLDEILESNLNLAQNFNTEISKNMDLIKSKLIDITKRSEKTETELKTMSQSLKSTSDTFIETTKACESMSKTSVQCRNS